MNSPKVGAHVKCKAYQRGWLKLSIAFKLVKILLIVARCKYIPTQISNRSKFDINTSDAMHMKND
jgi:hypothetical protein